MCTADQHCQSCILPCVHATKNRRALLDILTRDMRTRGSNASVSKVEGQKPTEMDPECEGRLSLKGLESMSSYPLLSLVQHQLVLDLPLCPLYSPQVVNPHSHVHNVAYTILGQRAETLGSPRA
jgi:hypothetical protein